MDRGKIVIENNIHLMIKYASIVEHVYIYTLFIVQCFPRFTKKVANRKYTVFYVHQVCV